MKIGLVFPPPFDLTQPYLSLPMLASFLQQQGHAVHQLDLNLAFYDHVLSRAYLSQAYEVACALLARARENETDPERLDLLRRATRIGRSVAELIDDAKAELRDPVDFYDPKRYTRNYRLLHRGCEMLSAVFFPSRITPTAYTMGYETRSIAESLEAAGSREGNPFYDVFDSSMVPQIVDLQLDAVGVSVVYSDQVIPALTLARLIKAAAPQLPILFGGDVFSQMLRLPRGNVKPLFDFVDGFVLDDGRQPLTELGKGTALNRVPGIITRSSSQLIPKIPDPPENLDEFGIPDFSGLPIRRYFAPPHVMPLLSGKGCKWSKCLFCSESFAKHFAPQSMDTVIAAIEKVVQDGARCVTFADVDIPPERLLALAGGLIDRRISVSWSCYARLTRWMDGDLLAKIAHAGCRRIYFGFESASQRVLNLMRKGTQIALAPQILESCWTAGISPHLFSFVGFPGETRAEAELTSDFFVANHRHIGSFNIGAFRLQTFSDIYREANAFQLEPNMSGPADGDAFDHPYRVRDGMDFDEAILLSAELTERTYKRISEVSTSFCIHHGSNYVGRAGVPPWNSHSLAYLAHHGHSWNLPDTAVSHELQPDTCARPLRARDVQVISNDDDAAVVFNPHSGKFLALDHRLLRLLESCDGTLSVPEIMERARRQGVAAGHALNALNQAIREDLVTLASAR
jgi:anaerobic magnesium-protoporphyrin IX monomethyl ester cyclase